MMWFTSDNHFGHKNVIKYCNRPFKNIQDMNELMIYNWNCCVMPDDIIFHLGDFSFLGMVESTKIVSRLNGYKILIKGNHDKSRAKMLRMGFNEVMKKMILPINSEDKFVLSHYPYKDQAYDPTKRTKKLGEPPIDAGSWLLCGHIHNRWKTKGKMINVGVDQWKFAPCSIVSLVKLRNEINDTHNK